MPGVGRGDRVFAFDPFLATVQLCTITYTKDPVEGLNRIRRENSRPNCFLILLIPQIDQDTRFISNRESRYNADLSGDPQPEARRQECLRHGLLPAIYLPSCSKSHALRDRI